MEGLTDSKDPVAVVNRKGMPELTDLRFPLSGTGAGPGDYTITNGSNSGLIALEILFHFRTTEGFRQAASWEDNWISGLSIIPAGSYVRDSFEGYLGMQSGRITQVIGTVSYAEYEDGTTLGDPERAALFSQRREEVREGYLKLRDAYNTGGAEGFTKALEGVKGESVSQRSPKVRLQRIYRAEGMASVLADISRVLSKPKT